MTITAEPPAGATAGGSSAALDAAARFLDRFVSWPTPAACDVAALWALSTHCTDRNRVLVFASHPRLAFLSDLPASGKTFAMSRTMSLCARPVICTDPTAPALAKIISEAHATVGIDEIDLLLRKGTSKQEVRTILNSGYSRNGQVLRASGQIPVFGPVALAGLDVGFSNAAPLRATYSRSVCIRMKAAAAGSTEPYRERLHDPQAHYLAEVLESWAMTHLGAVADSWPDMPDGADNRLADIWEPLITVADVAGGEWPARARAAFTELGSGRESSSPTVAPGQRIIGDLAAVWPADESRLASSTVIGRLVALRGAPYGQLWPQPELAGGELAALLAPFGIAPAKLRVDGQSLRGYTRDQFAAAWAAEQVASVPADHGRNALTCSVPVPGDAA